jgi:hypothetical protein
MANGYAADILSILEVIASLRTHRIGARFSGISKNIARNNFRVLRLVTRNAKQRVRNRGRWQKVCRGLF